MADIGKEVERITIEPQELPAPTEVPEFEPALPTPDRELVPA